MRQLVAIIIVVLGFAASASAQAVVKVNPVGIEFTSSDHNSPLNKPDTYVVDFFADGATSALQSPSIAASAVTVVAGTSPQVYRIAFSQLTAYPAGIVFTVKVRGVSATGAGDPSAASDPFGKGGKPATTSRPNLVP